MIRAVNYGIELASNIVYEYPNDKELKIEEEGEEPKLFTEAFAPFALRCNVKLVEVSPASGIKIPASQTDDKLSKKSSVRRYSPYVPKETSTSKRMTVPVTNDEVQFMST
jgi:hypothetical protein